MPDPTPTLDVKRAPQTPEPEPIALAPGKLGGETPQPQRTTECRSRVWMDPPGGHGTIPPGSKFLAHPHEAVELRRRGMAEILSDLPVEVTQGPAGPTERAVRPPREKKAPKKATARDWLLKKTPEEYLKESPDGELAKKAREIIEGEKG